MEILLLLGGVTVNKIAKWDSSGSTWEALSNGINGNVFALEIDSSNNVYAGFVTNEADTLYNLNYLAKWNGTSWSNVGNSVNDNVYALGIDSSGNLYAGGDFTQAGGITANRVAKWGKK